MLIISQLVLITAFATTAPHDTEWPPAKDPIDSTTPPHATLAMGKITLALPFVYGQYMNHPHTQGCNSSSPWNATPTFCAFGDIEGVDDGDLDVLLYCADEYLLAARVVIDWDLKLGHLEPLWEWIGDGAQTVSTAHCGADTENVLIWDFDGDGANEVAFTGTVSSSQGARNALIIASTPSACSPPGCIPPPPPTILAAHKHDPIGQRLSLCRLSDTDGPREIFVHDHNGTKLQVWRPWNPTTSSWSPELVYEKDANTTGALSYTKTHEFNCVDIDGDGYDEFFLDGVVDFVDKDPVTGLAINTNANFPSSGVQVWRTGLSNVGENHLDQMICADFDPSHPGLEINTAPSLPLPGWSGNDLMFDTAGAIVRDNTNGPANDVQAMFAGNWTSTRDGFETIFTPKFFGPPGEPFFTGCFAVDAMQNELALDGGQFLVTANGIGWRATGPGFDMDQIDWDGDYSQDEILNSGPNVMYVWRMGEKGDWGQTPPLGMPTNSVQSTMMWNECAAGGNCYNVNWYWYTGQPSWAFANNGPGPYSHYFEKKAEQHPGLLWYAAAHDLGGDYREEIAVVQTLQLDIYYNLDPLPNPWLHRTPRLSKSYQRFRMEMVRGPFDYQELPSLSRIDITPATSGLPPLGTTQLHAHAVYSDGSSVEVTNQVTWNSDAWGIAGIQGAGMVTANANTGSARITANLAGVQSEPAYLFVSASDAPSVLTGGFGDTWLSSAPGTLLVQARIAQKNNAPLSVTMSTTNASPFISVTIPMLDDGDPAHGDTVAGDGVYSASVDTTAYPSLFVSQTERLWKIQATLASNPSVRSLRWPFFVKGTSTLNLSLTGTYNNDAQGEARTPKIAWAGFRGYDNTNNVFVEAQVLPPADPTVQLTGCLLFFDGGPAQAMFPIGGDRYGLLIDASMLAQGTYLVEIVANAADSMGQPTHSDYWPRMRVH